MRRFLIAIGAWLLATGGAAASDAPIDLDVALRLAAADNPSAALAREAVREAQARELGARAQLLPTLALGGNLHVHRGALQPSQGYILAADRQSVYWGFGAQAVGAGTVAVPGVRLFGHLGDAAFEPLAARQRVAGRAAQSAAVQLTVLLEAATGYLTLAGADAEARSLRQSEAELAEVVRLTAAFAAAGQGRGGDADRAAAAAHLFRGRVQEAEGRTAAAAARLARVLALDPSVRLLPAGLPPPLALIDAEGELGPLVELAVRARPEVAAASAAVAEAATRVRQEKARPWLPTVSVGFSGARFAGGGNLAASDLGPSRGRADFDAGAVWTLGNAGLGNAALARRASGAFGQAVAEHGRVVNRVRAEVAEAKAAAQAAARRREIAARSLAAATEEFRLDSERIRQGQGLPIEVLDSFDRLAESRLEAIRADVDVAAAQFRLFAVMGNAPAAP